MYSSCVGTGKQTYVHFLFPSELRTNNVPMKSTPVTLNGLEQSVRDLGSGGASGAG